MMRVNSIKFTPACESSSNATRSRATSAASSSRHCEVNIQQKGNKVILKKYYPGKKPKQSGGSKKIVHFNVDGDGSADDDVDDDGDVDDDDDDGDGNADDDERRW